MISVIIPVFNSEKYLVRLFKCIDNQTYKNYEIILINDGSSDQSLRKCIEYSKRRYNVFTYSQNNRGVSIARNLGLEKARGEYIMFLDSDDTIPDNYFEELVNGMSLKEVDISVCDVVILNKNIEMFRFESNDGVISKEDALNKIISRKTINSGPYGKIFKRTVIGDNRFECMKTYEDILFVIDVFNNAKKVNLINTTEYQYIQNEGSAMDAVKKHASQDVIVATERILNFIEKNSYLNPECVYVTLSHLLQYYKNALISNNISFVRAATGLFRKHRIDILKCSAFPLKEKIVFVLLGSGIFYNNGQFINVKRRLQ